MVDTPLITAPNCKCDDEELVIIKAIAERLLVYKAADVFEEARIVVEGFLVGKYDMGTKMRHFISACPPIYLTALCPIIRKALVKNNEANDTYKNIKLALTILPKQDEPVDEAILCLVKTDMVLVLWFNDNALDWHERLDKDKKLHHDLQLISEMAYNVTNKFMFIEDKISSAITSSLD